jgi:hypothetical protein
LHSRNVLADDGRFTPIVEPGAWRVVRVREDAVLRPYGLWERNQPHIMLTESRTKSVKKVTTAKGEKMFTGYFEKYEDMHYAMNGTFELDNKTYSWVHPDSPANGKKEEGNILFRMVLGFFPIQLFRKGYAVIGYIHSLCYLRHIP